MRIHPNRLLWICFVVFVPASLFSLPPTENAHGVIVKFRSASTKTHAQRNALHAQMNTRLIYRPKRSSYDFVLPTDSDKQRDFSALSKLCQNYQAASAVAECEISYDLMPRDESPKHMAGKPAVDAPQCELVSHHGAERLKNGTLSPLWAQEMTGVDLVAFPRNAARMGVAVRVAIIDQGFGDTSKLKKKPTLSVVPGAGTDDMHGALSLGLLTGPTPFSLQAPIEVTHLLEVRHTADFLKVLEVLEAARPAPSVIHIGVDLGGQSNLVYAALKRLSAKSTLVAASGNDWPVAMQRNDAEFPGILVGSLSPEGYPSQTSAAGPSLAISAPSDRYLQSTTDGKTAQGFGGGSGASAMATSAIAAAVSLVPDLTLEQIQALLKHTALPTPSSLGGQQGPGSLNAVHFLAVADRIRAQGIAGPQRDKLLRTSHPRLFSFQKESQKMLADAKATLENDAAPCSQRQNALRQLRRAFLLHPAGEAPQVLAAAYTALGLASNAAYAGNLDLDALTENLKKDVASPDNATRVGAARVAAALEAPLAAELLVQFAANQIRSPAAEADAPNTPTKEAIQALARGMAPDARARLAAGLKAHSSGDVRRLAESVPKTP